MNRVQPLASLEVAVRVLNFVRTALPVALLGALLSVGCGSCVTPKAFSKRYNGEFAPGERGP